MSKRKDERSRPGPGKSRTQSRGSDLIATGRSLPPSGSLKAMGEQLPKHWWQSRGFKSWQKRVVLTLVVLIVATGAFVGWKFYANISRLFGGNFFGLFSSTKLRGEDSGHVNILIAGYSADDPGHSGADLTDSIMIASINTNNHSAFLLSVPRDLWVNIPDYGYAKINAAYKFSGGSSDNTAAGMAGLENIVSQKFGLPIDYYALVNYAAIRDAVNAVGGIDVTIKSDNPYGIYDPSIDWSTGGPLADYSNGVHHLDGQQALDLSRARGDAYGSYGLAGGDYARTDYQRQMLIAVKDKAMTAGTLANPFTIAKLLDAVGNNVKTNFTTSEIHRLYDIAKGINNQAIKSYGLNDIDGKPLVDGTYIDGQSVQVPVAGNNDYSGVKSFVDSLLNPPAKPAQH